jgi:DNA ligase-associated metallophosphoesterase
VNNGLRNRELNQSPDHTNKGVHVLSIKEQELWLLPERALYRPALRELIISDVHIGKAAHFRKNGIPVSGMINRNNFWQLSGLFDKYQVQTVVFLGDLSHSEHNQEWDDFVDFLENYPHIQFELVAGNHDVLSKEHYLRAGISLHPMIIRNEWCYLHEYQETPHFTLSGHLHPAIRLYGKARQSIKLDCFWLRENDLILPAFGDFTGRKMITPEPSHQFFLIAGKEVIKFTNET